jgi:hypothetical protein
MTVVLNSTGEPQNAKPADEGGLVAVPARATRWPPLKQFRNSGFYILGMPMASA